VMSCNGKMGIRYAAAGSGEARQISARGIIGRWQCLFRPDFVCGLRNATNSGTGDVSLLIFIVHLAALYLAAFGRPREWGPIFHIGLDPGTWCSGAVSKRLSGAALSF